METEYPADARNLGRQVLGREGGGSLDPVAAVTWDGVSGRLKRQAGPETVRGDPLLPTSPGLHHPSPEYRNSLPTGGSSRGFLSIPFCSRAFSPCLCPGDGGEAWKSGPLCSDPLRVSWVEGVEGGVVP